MSSTPDAMLRPGTCVLDWENREGFFPTTYSQNFGGPDPEVYGILYYADDSRSVNAAKHIPRMGDLPDSAAVALLQADRWVRHMLGFDIDADGYVQITDSSMSANIGGPVAGALIPNHLHIITVNVLAGVPSEGMGIQLLREMFNLWHGTLGDLVADFDKWLKEFNLPADVVAAIQNWRTIAEQNEAEKRRRDAIRR